MKDKKEAREIAINVSAKTGGKTKMMRQWVDEILNEDPNARIALVSAKGNKVVVSNENTELNEVKDNLKSLNQPNGK